MNLFWLFLILRIAKNYVFTSVGQDERSDDEDDDEEEEEEESEDHHGEKTITNGKTNGVKPVVLVNGEPVEAQSKPAGVRARKRKG